MMEYYDDDPRSQLSEFEIKINELIEEQVDKRVTTLKDELDRKNKLVNDLTKERNNLREENKQLKNTNNQIKIFEVFKGLVNENNFGSFLCHFNLKSNSINFDGMNSDDIPKWFKWLTTYYEDRDKLFLLMDLFNVKYPFVAKNIKMPYDYSEEELDIIFDKLGKMYVTNGCIFSGNMGFWHRELSYNQYDFHKLMTKATYVEIPWQLLLKNKLLLTDKYFSKITEAIRNNKSHSQYFYAISKYQDLSDDQIKELAKLLSKKYLSEEHKDFISRSKNIIKDNVWLAEKFKEKINDNQYSAFYFLNYPLEMQKEFIRSNKHSKYYTILDLIKKMDVSKEEKLEFLQEFAEKEF